MRIIVCGAGQVGWQIARYLAGAGNDVTVVDNNATLVRRAAETLEVRGVSGFASHPQVLEEAGARDADMLIAATFSDEVNMVTCQVAHSVFGVTRKIARLRAQSYADPRYSDLYRREHMPIDVIISPEREVAEAALQRLNAPEAFDTEDFLGGRAQLLGIALEAQCPVLNTPLTELTELFSTLRATVVGIRRAGRLFAPEATDQLLAGDEIYVLIQIEDLDRTLEIFGKRPGRQERMVIVGAGNVGLGLAMALERGKRRVRCKLIELDRGRAERAADALERTVVLNGDGLDAEMLEEAGIDRADAVLTLTNDDKVNMLAAVRGKTLGCRLAIALVNDPALMPLTGPLDIDATLNPRATTVSSILRHVRHGRVRQIYSLGDGEAEVIEAQVLNSSPIAGQRIADIDFPEGVLVGAVLKKGEFVRPRGETLIEEGDLIVIFALAADVPEVERLVQVSVDYF